MAMIKTIERYPIITIICLTFLMMLPSLGTLQVTIMEARNFISAREMISDGSWILTTMNGVARYEKPPLPTWITALSGLIFGIKNIFALRLPTVIMISIVGVYSYLFSTLFLEKRQSIINGFIAISSFYVLVITIEAPWDIYTHAFMLIAIFHLARAYSSKQIPDILIAALFIAFSVLSKGPISLFALLLPFLVAYAIVFGVKNKFVLKTIIPLIVGILLGGIWFYYVRITDPDAFREIASKETANWSSYNVRPFYYYWSFFIQSGLWSIPAFISLLYPYLKDRVSNKKVYKLSFFWTILSVILLSLIPEKKSRYLMPVLIPLAINTGFYIQYLVREFIFMKRKIEILPVYINFGLIGIVGILSPVFGFFIFKENLSAVLPIYLLSSVLLFCIGALLVYHLYKKNTLNVFYLTVLFFISIMCTAAPALIKTQLQKPYIAPISSLKSEADEQNLKIYYFDKVTPETLWHFGEKIPQITNNDGVFQFPLEQQFGVLVNNKDSLFESTLPNHYEIEELAVYNLNQLGTKERKHKVRYMNYYYLFTQKEN